MANEKRLIDANEPVGFLKEQRVKETGAFSNGVNKGLNIAISALRNAEITPTVDAVEVVHGRWEFVPSEKYGRHYTDAICTACKAVLDTHCDNDLEYRQENIKKKLLYCPNCGAKMDGGNGDG